MQLPFLPLEWFSNAFWVIPVMGTAVCCLAFLLGWRFLHSRTTAQVVDEKGFIDARFLQGVTRERRATTRRKGNTVEVELTDESDAPPLRASVINRSYGGLCLLAVQPITVGKILRVRPLNAAAAIPWTEVTICSCREDDGQYELGCQFHRTPNYSLLLMFG